MYTEFESFLHGTHKGMPVLIIGAHAVGGDLYFVYIEDDGMVNEDLMESFIVDVRFRDGKWHDVDPGFESDG